MKTKHALPGVVFLFCISMVVIFQNCSPPKVLTGATKEASFRISDLFSSEAGKINCEENYSSQPSHVEHSESTDTHTWTLFEIADSAFEKTQPAPSPRTVVWSIDLGQPVSGQTTSLLRLPKSDFTPRCQPYRISATAEVCGQNLTLESLLNVPAPGCPPPATTPTTLGGGWGGDEGGGGSGGGDEGGGGTSNFRITGVSTYPIGIPITAPENYTLCAPPAGNWPVVVRTNGPAGKKHLIVRLVQDGNLLCERYFYSTVPMDSGYITSTQLCRTPPDYRKPVDIYAYESNSARQMGQGAANNPYKFNLVPCP